MSIENGSLRAVRTALRAVLGRLGQASVPLIQSFNVQAMHRRKTERLCLGTDGSPSRPRTPGTGVRTIDE